MNRNTVALHVLIKAHRSISWTENHISRDLLQVIACLFLKEPLITIARIEAFSHGVRISLGDWSLKQGPPVGAMTRYRADVYLGTCCQQTLELLKHTTIGESWLQWNEWWRENLSRRVSSSRCCCRHSLSELSHETCLESNFWAHVPCDQLSPQVHVISHLLLTSLTMLVSMQTQTSFHYAAMQITRLNSDVGNKTESLLHISLYFAQHQPSPFQSPSTP